MYVRYDVNSMFTQCRLKEKLECFSFYHWRQDSNVKETRHYERSCGMNCNQSRSSRLLYVSRPCQFSFEDTEWLA
jgi:hypothetical protein